MSFIKRINKKDDNIILEFYDGEDIKVEENIELKEISKDSNTIRICFLDVETTGFDVEECEVIELAMKVIEINKNDGSELKSVKKYESYNDPDSEISEEITKLTGISNDMVKDKSIDWDEVSEILNMSQLVVAHNARFDRKFIDKYIQTKNIWACSQGDIEWKERGFFKQGLEMLCIWHGFYYAAHRAMNDVNAMIHLLMHNSYSEDLPILELISNAKKPWYKIINKFPYNEKHIKLIKSRRLYRYEPNNKSWSTIFNDEAKIQEEKEWLEENIYEGYFKGQIQLLTIYDKYKDNI